MTDLGLCPLSGFVEECEDVKNMGDCIISYEKKEDGKYKQCKVKSFSTDYGSWRYCKSKSNAFYCQEPPLCDPPEPELFSVSYTTHPRMFEYACEDAAAKYVNIEDAGFNESACAFPTPARNIIKVKCPSSITKTLDGIDYTFDSITTVNGVPNCDDQENQNDCNTVDESTGLSPRGWETESSCIIAARTTHTYCDNDYRMLF